MRGATQCAQRLKQLFRTLRTKLGKVPRPTTGDTITQLILGIFSRDVPETKAREALDKLRSMVVDYNELRVVPPIEMADMVGELPNARLKCEDLSRALNKIFAIEHEVSLERLRSIAKRDSATYIDEIDGLDAYSRARIRLLGLQMHAIPLDEAMWAYARQEEIVDPKCPLDEAQGFLERRIAEDEALDFVALLEKQAWSEMGAAVRAGKTERIASLPPDRTSRNMLQMVATGRSADDDVESPEPPAAEPAPAEPTADESLSQLAAAPAMVPDMPPPPPTRPAPPAKKTAARAKKTTRKAATKTKATTAKKKTAAKTAKKTATKKAKAAPRKTTKKKATSTKTKRAVTTKKTARSRSKAKS